MAKTLIMPLRPFSVRVVTVNPRVLVALGYPPKEDKTVTLYGITKRDALRRAGIED